MKRLKLAVTGSTGHVGAALLKALTKEGYEVIAIYRNELKLNLLEGSFSQKRQGDVLDFEFLKDAFLGCDAVIHLAGVISIDGDPDGQVMKVNVEGTRNVVEACMAAGVKKLIHFSSIHSMMYDEYSPIVNEESPLADATCTKYDYSKALGELEVQKGVEKGLEACILNPTGIIGPYDYWGSHSGNMLLDLFNGTMPALVKGGFDWVDVRDVAKAAILALEKGKKGEKYLIGGHWAMAMDLANLAHRVSGRKPPRIVFPIWAAMLGLPFVKLQSKLTKKPPMYTYEALKVLKHASRNMSFEKARNELAYEAKPLEETIRDAFEWYKSEGKVK